MTTIFVAVAFVALASTVAYQNAVTIPHLKGGASPSLGQVYGPTFSLPADRPGAWTPQVSIHPVDGFLLDFKFNPTYLFNSYFCQLQDASGHPLLQTRVSAEKVNQELHLAVPQGVVQRPGSYALVLLGADPGAEGQFGTALFSVLHLPFYFFSRGTEAIDQVSLSLGFRQ